MCGGRIRQFQFFFLLQIAKFAQLIFRKYKQLEERIGRIYRRYKHPDGNGKKGGAASGNYYDPIYEEIPEQRSITSLPPSAIDSNRSSELGMEYDDVETILLGKLSAKDLAGVVDVEPEGEEKFNPLQLEVEADIEPVKEQPLYANIQANKESSPSPKVKKRKRSTHKHHSKPEPTHHHSNRHKKHCTREEGDRGGEQGHKIRLSPSQLRIHNEQFRQMGVASLDRPLPPPPSFPPPPPPPYGSPQRAPPNAPLLIDFTDMPLQDSPPASSKQ